LGDEFMSEAEINRAIAEACGTDNRWTVMKRGLYYRPNAKGYTNRQEEAWIMTEAEADQETYPYDEPVTKHRLPVPPYCTDLNAMHEAEKVLSGEQYHTFTLHVSNAGWKALPFDYLQRLRSCWSATARQRAEALLRTLGKWSDSPTP
jgi:hypothetical protein